MWLDKNLINSILASSFEEDSKIGEVNKLTHESILNLSTGLL